MADDALDVSDGCTAGADEVVVIVADAQFVEGSRSGRLDPAHDTGFGQVGERIVYRLNGCRGLSELGVNRRSRRVREPLQRSDNRKSARGDPEAGSTQLIPHPDHSLSLALIVNDSKQPDSWRSETNSGTTVGTDRLSCPESDKRGSKTMTDNARRRTQAEPPVVNADVELDAAPTLTRRLGAEAFGTFVLVFGIIGTALFASANTGWLGVALAAGLTVLGSAYAVGHISGGHFNPAVSIGAAVAGRFPWRDVLPYIGAQVVGGVVATTILFAIKADAPDDVAGFDAVSNGFAEHSPEGYGLLAVIIAEFVLTAIFVHIILGVTDRRAPSGFAPLAIGLTLTLVHLVGIPISNASFNPARSIATAIYGGPDSLIQLWVFILVPIAGALVAGAVHRAVFDRRAV